MASTATDIILQAFENDGIYAPGETPTDADSSRALIILNDMISMWNEQFLFPYVITSYTATMVSGTASYAVAPGSAVSQPRPFRISYGPGVATYTLSGTTTLVNSVSKIEWQSLYANNASITTAQPSTIWYDPQVPAGILNVYPTPGTGVTGALAFPAWTQFTAFTGLTDSYTFGPGVLECLKANLAVAVQPFFQGAQIRPDIAVKAAESKLFLQHTNQTSRSMLRRGLSLEMARGGTAG